VLVKGIKSKIRFGRDRDIEDSGFVPRRVDCVSPVGKGVVYSLEIGGDSTYLIEGYTVHNCKHVHRVFLSYPLFAKTLEKYLIREEIVKKNYGAEKTEQVKKKVQHPEGRPVVGKIPSPFKSTVQGPTVQTVKGPSVNPLKTKIEPKSSPFRSSFRPDGFRPKGFLPSDVSSEPEST